MSEDVKLSTGNIVKTGLLPPTEADKAISDAMLSYPPGDESKWMLDDKQIERALVINGAQRYLADRKKRAKRMRNQGNIGSCNACSNASAMEQLREIQGMPPIPLNQCFTYINVNGGQDQGSTLPSTYDNIQKVGVAPYRLQCGGMTKTFPNNAFKKSQVPADVWAQAVIEAKQFLGIKLIKLPTKDFKEFCRATASAIALNLPIVWAWMVGSDGSRLKNGYMQIAKGPGNHSNLLHSGKWVGGAELVHPCNQNSWGPVGDELYGEKGAAWGDGGFGLCTMEQAFACAHIHPPYVCVSVRAHDSDSALQL